jgi:site-specific recombinase XerD
MRSSLQEQEVTSSTEQPDYVTAFLLSLRQENLAEGSLRAYGADIDGFLDYCRLLPKKPDVGLLSSVHLGAYIQHLVGNGAKYATVRRNVIGLRRFFGFLVQQRALQRNPFAGLRITPQYSDVLPLAKLTEMFQYCSRREIEETGSEKIRYLRDQVILMFIVFLGVRQYQIPRLRLSAITRQDRIMTLKVSEKAAIQLEGPIMARLKSYLNRRDSSNDLVFLEPESNRPVRTSSIAALLLEISYAVRIQCTPVALFHTYQHFMLYPELLAKVLEDITPNSPG